MWNALVLDPMVNVLIWLYGMIGNSYGLAIVAFTVLTRLSLLPLALWRSKYIDAMRLLQPKLKKIQKEYRKDKKTLSRKTMELYQREGVWLNGCLPAVIQVPILIGLNQAIRLSAADSPSEVQNLFQHVYQSAPAWLPNANSLIPLNNRFLWLDLAAPDPYYILPALLVLTAWLAYRLMPATDLNSQPQPAWSRFMIIAMPLSIFFVAPYLPSALLLYWVIGSLIGLALWPVIGHAALMFVWEWRD